MVSRRMMTTLTFHRRWCAHAIIALSLVLAAPAAGEDLPTQGSFRGYYHVNAAGVGRLRFLIFPPELKERLAPFDGEYIEVEVLGGTQPFSPGDVYVQELGRITELKPPLTAELRAFQSVVYPGAIDIVALITNIGDEALRIDDNNAFMHRLDWPDERLDNATLPWAHGYTVRQLGFGVHSRYIKVQAGQWHPYSPDGVILEPGMAVPLVWQAVRPPPTNSELHFQLGDPLPPDARPEAWLPGSACSAPQPAPKPAWRVESIISREAEWFNIDARLLPTGDNPAFLCMQSSLDQIELPGEIHFFASGDERYEAIVDRSGPHPNDVYRPQRVGKAGIRWQARVRCADAFAAGALERIEFWLPTATGMLPLILGTDLGPLSDGPLPSWGPQTDNARLRIRVPRTSIHANQPLYLDYQAESLADGARVFRGLRAAEDDNGLELATVLLVDDHYARRFSGGAGYHSIFEFPIQGRITSYDPWALRPGHHTLQLLLTSGGPDYVNTRGEFFPSFFGTLASNIVEFDVLPAPASQPTAD